jgi:hypothetical protein
MDADGAKERLPAPHPVPVPDLMNAQITGQPQTLSAPDRASSRQGWAEVRPCLFAVNGTKGAMEWWWHDEEKTINLAQPPFVIPKESWNSGFPPFFGDDHQAIPMGALDLRNSWDEVYDLYRQDAQDQYGQEVGGDWKPSPGDLRVPGTDQWCEARRGLFAIQASDNVLRWWYHDATRTVAFRLTPPFDVDAGRWRAGVPPFLAESFTGPTDDLDNWCQLGDDWDEIYETLYEDERNRLESEEENRQWEAECEREIRAEDVAQEQRTHTERNHEFEFESCPICKLVLSDDDSTEDDAWASLDSSADDVYEWLALYGDLDEAKRWEALGFDRLYPPSGWFEIPEEPNVDFALDLADAIRFRKTGMTIDQAESMHRLPSLDDTAEWRKWFPATAVALVIGPKDRKRRWNVNRAVRNLQSARVKRGPPTAEAHQLAEVLMTAENYVPSESGRAGTVNGAHYQMAWVAWASERNPKVPNTVPGLALLRNDAVLHVRSDYVDSQYHPQIGFWRGRYASWSAWSNWDLRLASEQDYTAFADDAAGVVAELFSSDNVPAGSKNISVMDKGIRPWWMFPQVVAHPTGDFLEQRFGFEAVIQTIYEMSNEPNWWTLTLFWLDIGDAARNALLTKNPDWVDVSPGQLTDDAWHEVVRRMERSR